MGIIPQLKTSCCCCTLKTGSFVIAVLLLVGSSVQTGFYAYLVDHIQPQKICTFEEPVVNIHYYQYIPDEPDEFNDFFYPRWRRRNISFPAPQHNSSYPVSPHNFPYPDSRYKFPRPPTNGRVQLPGEDSANTTQEGDSEHRRDKRGFQLVKTIPGERKFYQRPCKRDRIPFDVDSDYLDFDLRGSFDKSILYFNIVVWASMMAATPLLMYAVYKECVRLVSLWLVSETFLLLVGTSSTVATSVFLIGAVPITIGIVTLFNMVIHFAIDVYFLMVVFNYRRQLKSKVQNNTNNEQQTV